MPEYRYTEMPYVRTEDGNFVPIGIPTYKEVSQDYETLKAHMDEYSSNVHELKDVHTTFNAAFVKLSIELFVDQSKEWTTLVEGVVFCDF